MSILGNNKLLQSAEREIERKLTPQTKPDFEKIVVAGMKLILHGGKDGILAKLKDSKDPINDCAVGAINLVLTMRQQSRGTMPGQAMVPAAMVLMLSALDFADKADIVRVGKSELVKATHIFTNHLFKQIGVSPDMLRNLAAKTHGLVQDPAKMQKLAERAGVVKAGGGNGV